MPSKRQITWRPTEPARAPAYIKLKQLIDSQDDKISFLLELARMLQRRIEQLEATQPK